MIRYLLLVNGIHRNVKFSNISSDIVISLTTLSERIYLIFSHTVFSIRSVGITQKIIVWIPKYSIREQKEVLLEDLPDIPMVEYRMIDRDLGPITKLIPSLIEHGQNPNQRIICLDDDIIYSRHLIESYEAESRKNPEAALAIIGYDVPTTFNDKNRFKTKVYATDIQKRREVDVVTGYGSFMIKPTFFAQHFLTEQRPKEAYFTDDLCVSGHLAQQDVKKYIFPVSWGFSHLKRLSSWSDYSLTTRLIKTALIMKL